MRYFVGADLFLLSVKLATFHFGSYRMTTRVWIGVVTLYSTSFFAGHLWAASSSPSTSVRTDVVLKVGSAEISHYAVEKNLTRFQRTGSGHGLPSSEAACAWFGLFLSRQVILAEALKAGYAQRPEVTRMVGTMEQHMLAQTEPAVAPPTDAELHDAYDKFPEQPGRTKPPFEQQRPFLEKKLLQDRRLAVKRTQRDQAVAVLKLEIVHETVAKLLQCLQAEPSTTVEVSEKLVAPLAGERLATYRLGDETMTLTVDGWRERFNALFVRERQTSTAQLEANIRDLVVAEFAASEARRLGLDREPRFAEDRRNFVYAQALDLFEKEKLLPQIEIKPAEAEAYYREHSAEFMRPARAKGKLHRFADVAAAMAWMHAPQGKEEHASETIVVSRESPLPGAPKATEPILHLRAGMPHGPIPTPDGALVFINESTETEPLPYATVKEAILAKLGRTQLDALELKLAREWAPHYVIEDGLRPEEFGLNGPVEKPWKVEPLKGGN